MKYHQNSLTVLLAILGLCVLPRLTRADDLGEEYRFTAFPYYKFTSNFVGFAQLGYAINPDNKTQTYNLLSPGMYYTVLPWFEAWGGLNDRYNQINGGANTFLFRPYLGPKLLLPNKWKWNLYNFTQYEYRATDNLDTHDWSYDQRLRSRFEADIPLAFNGHKWQPRTFYSITSVEPFYDFEQNDIIQLRVSGGLGYVLSKYAQLELVYYAQFNRADHGASLNYNENIFRLNLKIGLNRKNNAQEAAAINSQ